MEATKHICGQCNNSWATEAEYIAHTCQTTGVTPTDPLHQGAEFLEVQKAALERGLERVDPTDVIQVEEQKKAIDEVTTQAEAIADTPIAAAAPVDQVTADVAPAPQVVESETVFQ